MCKHVDGSDLDSVIAWVGRLGHRVCFLVPRNRRTSATVVPEVDAPTPETSRVDMFAPSRDQYPRSTA